MRVQELREPTIIADVVSSFTTAMPDEVRRIYVAGSYAEGRAMPASDIDLIAILRESADNEPPAANVESGASQS